MEKLLHKGFYNKGDLVFQQGEPPSGCYLLCQGAVKLVWRTRRGEKQILRLLRPGEVIALESLYGGGSRTYVKALERAQAAFIAREDLKALITEFPALGREMVGRLAKDTLYVERRWARRAHRGVKERLSRLLGELGGRFGVESEKGLIVDLELSRRELAEMLGCSTVSLYKALRDLEERRIISFEERKIVIKDAGYLHQISE